MNKPARLLDGMPYTPAAATTPEYLKAKFRKIQREIEAQKQKVTPITKQRKQA